MASLRDLDGFREVSTTEVSSCTLRTHFKYEERIVCVGEEVNIFGLHILAKPRSHAVLVAACDSSWSKYGDDFLERVFNGFNYGKKIISAPR